MAADNDKIIEKLVASLSSVNDKLVRRIEKLDEKINKAVSENATKEYVSILKGEMDRLSNAYDTQKNAADQFKEEMRRIALNKKQVVSDDKLETLYKLLSEYGVILNEIEALKRKQATETRPSEKSRIGTEIALKKAELSDKKLDTQKEFGTWIDFTTNKPIKNENLDPIRIFLKKFFQEGKWAKQMQHNMQQAVLAAQEEEIDNSNEIHAAYVRNNEELKKTKDYWNAIKTSARFAKDQIVKGGMMWLKFNEQAISDAKRLGMTSKNEAMAYTKALIDNAQQLSRNFGVSAEQAMKIQDSYAKVTGRATLLTTSQMEDITAASKLMGDETVQNAISIMDKMGTTSQATMELMDKNYLRAASSGLDTVKASEEFVKNMSLANKLNFRNGVDGISRMTILSQRIKMNLQEVASVAEKMSSIEGAIEASARLQVLGGAGSMYGSNPMQLLYESLADPEALFKRMGDMFSQQAYFDRSTGEARIDPLQMQIMKEQAKALGMNPEEAIQSAKQQAKLQAIEGDMRTFAPAVYRMATEEQKSAIQNKAEFDKERNTWVVKYMDQMGEMRESDIRDLTQDQIKDISKDNLEDVQDIRLQVRKIAGELVGTRERWNSMKEQISMGVASAGHWVGELADGVISAVNESPLWKMLTTTGAGLIGLIGTGALAKGVWSVASSTLGKWMEGLFTGAAKDSTSLSRKSGSIVNIEEGNVATNTRTNTTPSSIRLGRVSRLAKGVAVVGGVAEGALKFYEASSKLSSSMDAISSGESSSSTGAVGVRKWVGRGDEFTRMRTQAENRANEEKAAAIGTGVGVTAGGLLGAALSGAVAGSIGGPVGTIAGLFVGALGAYLGGKYGGKIGREMAIREDDDIINKHLNEINKGDEEDNIRKIVLPVESIDYNVSLIANLLGAYGAAPARGNIYLEAEATGEINPGLSVGPFAGIEGGVPQGTPTAMAGGENSMYQPVGSGQVTVVKVNATPDETVSVQKLYAETLALGVPTDTVAPMAESKPLIAETVNRTNEIAYTPRFTADDLSNLNLNVNGSLDLKLDGMKFDELTKQIIMETLKQDSTQRFVMEFIAEQINKNRYGGNKQGEDWWNKNKFGYPSSDGYA